MRGFLIASFFVALAGMATGTALDHFMNDEIVYAVGSGFVAIMVWISAAIILCQELKRSREATEVGGTEQKGEDDGPEKAS